MRKKGRITLSDVAAAAGVSPMTVSRALLSAPHKVTDKTRHKVEETARILGYVPNLTASTLASRNSRIIAIVVSTLGASIFSNWITVFQTRLNEAGLHLLIGDCQYSFEKEQHLVESFLGRNPDAIILTSSFHNTETLTLLEKSRVPVLETWDLPETSAFYAIGFDNYLAGSLAGKHLGERGYNNVIFATSKLPSRDSILAGRFQRRWEGFSQSVGKFGTKATRYISKTESLEIDGGYQIMCELVREYPGVDAVFLDSDTLAAGALLYCAHNAIDVPSKMAICGLGGLPISRIIEPALTTVDIPHENLGQLAATTVLDMINGKMPREHRMPLKIELREGRTT